jgi:hypothetical protein
MCDKVLFISSIFMFLGNFPFIVISKHSSFIKYYYLTGLTTSLLNHGFNSSILQSFDRSTMILGVIVDTYYIIDTTDFQLLWLSIYSYFIAKYTGYKFFHVYAHILITILHNKILLQTFY